MRQKRWDFFFCLLVVGETRDWITSARPLQSRSASRFPSRFSAAHIIDTQRSSALDVEQGQSSSCLPPLILYTLPPLPHAHFFFLAFSTTTTLQFTCLPFLPLVSTHTHTHLSTPGAPVERELLGGDVRFLVPSVYKTHTHKRNLETVAADEQNISLSRKKFYFIFSLNSVTMRTNSMCVCVYVCRERGGALEGIVCLMTSFFLY